jgi:hypothetical protein
MATDRWARVSDAGYGSRAEERRSGGGRDPDRPWRNAGGMGPWGDASSSTGGSAARWATYEGGHNRDRAARDFGSGLGFGTGYGGQRDYDPGEHEAGPFLGGMYYGGGEVSRRGQGRDVTRARSAGPHRGRGPKGYMRTDERIFEDVCERMTDDAMLDASEIEVHISSGEVSLDGTVSDRAGKRRAELLAESIPGVGHVQNNLRVRPQAPGREPLSGASSGRSEQSNRSGPQGTGLGGGEVGPRGSEATRSDRGRRRVGASG